MVSLEKVILGERVLNPMTGAFIRLYEDTQVECHMTTEPGNGAMKLQP